MADPGKAPLDVTTCLVAGGGPAGMMLGLLLARAGVDVTVMEKHADFLRDFRGDTVHASTLRLLDELGLGDEFAALPHRMIDSVNATVQDTTVKVDLTRLPGPHKHIALVPQWDFLELLASAAQDEPTFRLMRSTEVLGPVRSGGRVTGVRYRGADGAEAQMRADLTVGCDGRSSTLRAAAGLATRSFGAPMDVWWFRLPRHAGDPHGLNGIFRSGHGCALIDRGDYFQIAYLIRKGADAAMRAEGIESLRRQVCELVPWLADRIDALESFDDVKLLDVQLDRLRRWYTDGLLFIGDAAHAMSPIGGVGINLAVADAVAAGRILADPLRRRSVTTRHLAGVQARRWLPAAIIQRVQRTVQDRAIAVGLGTDTGLRTAPRAVRLVNRFPALGAVAAYGVAIGPLPEHAPAYARR
ncbi:FAD-dependent oxidoreductase [Mycolicibacterium sp. 624]|uniref:FAD-dependent oxidoreductase n=1 Tax=Mycolicibacterium sp. 624 TaxID=3156314 RepID=UPI003393E2EF